MKKIVLIFYSLLFLLLIAIVGCDDTLVVSEIDKIVIPDSNVSYSQYIHPVFQVKCAFSGCHESGTRAGNLDLTTHATATLDPLIIFPGNPENSILVFTIDPRYGYPKMMPPTGYPPLTENQVIGIRVWIEEGAKNN